MSKADLRIDWATHNAAKYACENWHYSGCLPVGKLVKIGAWEQGKFIGVVLFSRGASPFLGAKYELRQTECVELVRVALRSHNCAVSRIISLALKFLKKACAGLKLVVSFADQSKGHHGGIYQAGNWLYTGQSNSVIEYYINGRWLHTREALGGAFGKSAKKKNVAKAAATRLISGKHRYLMPLDAEMRERIAPLAKPYPKREKQATAGDQPEGRRCNTDPHAPDNEAA